jgi:hypothetical protein
MRQRNARRRRRGPRVSYQPSAGHHLPERGQHDYPTVEAPGRFVFLPMETAERNPQEWFNVGGSVVLAQGDPLTTVVDWTIPDNTMAVLKRVEFSVPLRAALDPAGGLTGFLVLKNAHNLRGDQAPGASPDLVLPPDATLETPYLRFNTRLIHGTRLRVRLGRAGATDPAAYSYRVRLVGRHWPIQKEVA